MTENKPQRQKSPTKRSLCRLCQQECEPNKLLWNRDFREKLQDIAGIWIKICVKYQKYHVCSSCQNEVEVHHSFRKRCRQIFQEGGDDQPCLGSTSIATQSPSKNTNHPEDLPAANDHLQKPLKSKPRTKQRDSKQKSEVSVQIQTQDIVNNSEHQVVKPTKKLRPCRPRIRQTVEERVMADKEYKRVYYKKMLQEDYKQVCDICGKSIARNRMESHMNRHNGVEPYSCEECGMKFHCRNNLQKHINRSHAKGQAVTCEICQKVSISAIAYKQHLKAAHSEKRFQCTLCPVKTVTQHSLDQHMDIHNQRRDFVCPQCGKAFYRKYVLNIHLRTHSGETPYKCHVCADEAFVHRRIYVMHMKKHHPDEPLMRVDGTRTLKEALMQKDIG